MCLCYSPCSFESCLHIEVASLGVDVVAVHPSPVASNFYNDLDHKVDMIEAAARSAVPPSELPDDILRSIGPAALRDLGGTFLWVGYFIREAVLHACSASQQSVFFYRP